MSTPCVPCGGGGLVVKWQYVRSGQPVVEFDTQHEANAEQAKYGGAGRIQKIRRRP